MDVVISGSGASIVSFARCLQLVTESWISRLRPGHHTDARSLRFILFLHFSLGFYVVTFSLSYDVMQDAHMESLPQLGKLLVVGDFKR